MAQQSIALSTMQDTVRRALAKYPNEKARIERAAAIVAMGQLAPTGPDTFSVKSQTNPGHYYVVTVDAAAHWARTCSCPDAQRHADQPCKHQWSVSLLLVAQERQRRLDVRARFALLSADEQKRLAAWKRRYEAQPA